MAKQELNLDNIVQVQGTIEEQYAALKGHAWLTSSKVQGLRQDNPDFRNRWFRTGDGAVYQRDGSGSFILYVTSASLNPVLKAENFSDVVSQIRATGNYKVKKADLEEIFSSSKKKDGRVTVINMSKLSSRKNDDRRSDISYIEFSTADYLSELNAEDKRLARAYHGHDLAKSMKTLSKAGIEKTRVYFLCEEYLAEHARENPISRLSVLDNFNYFSNAIACDRRIDGNSGLALGVLLNTRRERVQKKAASLDANAAAAYLARHPREITEPVARQLLEISNKFYQNKR
jgi:hypothetical protein